MLIERKHKNKILNIKLNKWIKITAMEESQRIMKFKLTIRQIFKPMLQVDIGLV